MHKCLEYPHFNCPADYDRQVYTKEPKYQRVEGNSIIIIISPTLKAHSSQIWSPLFPIFHCTGLKTKHTVIQDYEYFQAGTSFIIHVIPELKLIYFYDTVFC